jgi:hypothetical protein
LDVFLELVGGRLVEYDGVVGLILDCLQRDLLVAYSNSRLSDDGRYRRWCRWQMADGEWCRKLTSSLCWTYPFL